MSRQFPKNEPMLQGVFAPVFVEGDSSDLPVTGDIPEALAGTLYRNGPNPQFAPRGQFHFFGGDGMVHAFTLENGRATYRNRWVRTPRFEIERCKMTPQPTRANIDNFPLMTLLRRLFRPFCSTFPTFADFSARHVDACRPR